jgi:hypothetical protein
MKKLKIFLIYRVFLGGKRIYKGTQIPIIGMRILAGKCPVPPKRDRLGQGAQLRRYILLVDCPNVIALSSYLFNSTSNPQLKVIPP